MSNITQFFYRDSYFTKKHDENNPNPNLINLFHKDSSIKNDSTNNKDNDNNNLENKSGRNSNNKSDSNDYDLYDEEIELFYAKVDTIIPIDNKLNSKAIYNIKIRSSLNFNDSWIKSCTLDELYDLREYLLKYVSSVINLPFPQKSWMRFLPYIGYKYDERNWDILLENKFLLDDFFSTICKDKEMYKLSKFISFFSKPVNKKKSIIFL